MAKPFGNFVSLPSQLQPFAGLVMAPFLQLPLAIQPHAKAPKALRYKPHYPLFSEWRGIKAGKEVGEFNKNVTDAAHHFFFF